MNDFEVYLFQIKQLGKKEETIAKDSKVNRMNIHRIKHKQFHPWNADEPYRIQTKPC